MYTFYLDFQNLFLFFYISGLFVNIWFPLHKINALANLSHILVHVCITNLNNI